MARAGGGRRDVNAAMYRFQLPGFGEWIVQIFTTKLKENPQNKCKPQGIPLLLLSLSLLLVVLLGVLQHCL